MIELEKLAMLGYAVAFQPVRKIKNELMVKSSAIGPGGVFEVLEDSVNKCARQLYKEVMDED